MNFDITTAIVTIAALVGLKLLVLLAIGKGSLARLGLATQAFTATLGDATVAARVAPLLNPPPPEPARPPRLASEPVRLLALLQREGRLLDFLLEDLTAASDQQIGAGVRDIHKKSKKVIEEHLTLEPILPGQEEAPVEVPPGFDPSAIRVTGNVTGNPPFKGTLKHHGWRVKGYKLPKPPEGQDDLVVAPAEVEI
jgi:hypothetical protein